MQGLMDLHTHTARCQHATGTLEEYVERAQALGIRHFGFSDHSHWMLHAIGKRYARTDEMGIPFAVTVDFDTLEDQSVTLRELVSMEQLRLPMADLKGVVLRSLEDNGIWASLQAKYPKAKVPEEEEPKA